MNNPGTGMKRGIVDIFCTGHKEKSTIMDDYGITEELVDKAIDLGWELCGGPKERWLSKISDKTGTWAAYWVLFNYKGEDVRVPHWLKRRIEELELEEEGV